MTEHESSINDVVHLSEVELDEVLLGMGSRAAEAHLALCQSCSAKIQNFESSITLFNQSSLGWSEARPIPAALQTAVDRIQTTTAPSPFYKTARSIGWACAVAALLVAGFEVTTHPWDHLPLSTVSNAASESTTQDSDSQIAEDNKLLQSVSSILSEDATSSITNYGLEETSAATPKLKPAPRRKRQ